SRRLACSRPRRHGPGRTRSTARDSSKALDVETLRVPLMVLVIPPTASFRRNSAVPGLKPVPVILATFRSDRSALATPPRLHSGQSFACTHSRIALSTLTLGSIDSDCPLAIQEPSTAASARLELSPSFFFTPRMF